MNRAEICAKVGEMITGPRNQTHGDPFDQFICAHRIKMILNFDNNADLTESEKEALSMICTKLSRISRGKPVLDHFLDIIGYAAIAAEDRSSRLSR